MSRKKHAARPANPEDGTIPPLRRPVRRANKLCLAIAVSTVIGWIALLVSLAIVS